MNSVQRAWLKVCGPLFRYWNLKIATRPGLLGRFGRFFRFGPREYGDHTSTKLLRYYGNLLYYVAVTTTNNYAPMRTISQKSVSIVRMLWPWSYGMNILVFSLLIAPITMFTIGVPDHESLAHLKNTTPEILLPSNSLEDRRSAHFIEVNRLYQMEMAKLISLKFNEIAKQYENDVLYNGKAPIDPAAAN